MHIVGDAVISDDIKENFFVCNLQKCRGACCVEGDSGAPLEEYERATLDEIYEEVKPFLTPEGIREIERQGTSVIDEDNDYVTPIINGRECVYAIRDQQGVLKCGIEQAHRAGKIDFKKPISCHLYPLRIDHYDHYDAINYHRLAHLRARLRPGRRAKRPSVSFPEGTPYPKVRCRMVR